MSLQKQLNAKGNMARTKHRIVHEVNVANDYLTYSSISSDLTIGIISIGGSVLQ
jgi:hypothetical protein